MVKLKTSLLGMHLENPIIPASGTFGFGKDYTAYYDINILGSIVTKAITWEPRIGNPTPRIAETPAGMLNAIGLQNPGVDHVIAFELPEMLAIYSKKVIANISGSTIDDYIEVIKKLNDVDNIGAFEINISCPNVKAGGMAFGTSSEMAAEVTRRCKEVAKKPILIKLSPNVTDIVCIAKAVEKAGADGISLINTVLGMAIDLKNKKPTIANKTGGLSGPAIKPIAIRMVYQVYEAVKIPIVGIGGINCCEDVLEFILAGATAVEIGSANLVDPDICHQIIVNLPKVMEKYGFSSIEDIIGGAHETRNHRM
ncbi:MAG: dihydroorotate dehydrogenase [Candidatus Izemoplasmatales bacterium]|nr:dihydroorotate dehydrogenase [Candidatus Izemoplasmatales bacterium]